MTSIEEIQSAIEALPKDEYTRLRKWFSDADWDQWNDEIELDSKSGKLDFLKTKAENARQKGLLGEL